MLRELHSFLQQDAPLHIWTVVTHDLGVSIKRFHYLYIHQSLSVILIIQHSITVNTIV